MSYVIWREDQGGGYVSRPGSASSYTYRLRDAQVFATKEQAERNLCPGNEEVKELYKELEKLAPLRR